MALSSVVSVAWDGACDERGAQAGGLRMEPRCGAWVAARRTSGTLRRAPWDAHGGSGGLPAGVSEGEGRRMRMRRLRRGSLIEGCRRQLQ